MSLCFRPCVFLRGRLEHGRSLHDEVSLLLKHLHVQFQPCSVRSQGKNRMWVPYSPCETVTPFLMLSRILLPSAVVTRACPASTRCALSIHGVLFSQRTSAEWSGGTWRGPLFPSSMYDRVHVHSAEWVEDTPLSRCPCAFASAFVSADGKEKETTRACPKSMERCLWNICK